MILKPLGIVEADPFSIHLNGDNDSSISARIQFPFGIELASGSAASPSINFTSSTSSGIFWDGSYVAFGYAGSTVFKYDGSTLQPVSAANANLGSTSNRWNNIVGSSLTVDNGGSARFSLQFSATTLWLRNNFTGVNPITVNSSSAVTLSTSGQNTTVKGNLVVSQNTTLSTSLTGILKGTSGLVATASSADILTAIGTIDISSNTNLAVSSPIKLTGDTVGFDFGTNNTWGGTQLWGNETWVKDDIKFYIGDNSGAAGNVSFLLDISNSGNLLVAADNGFSKAWIFTDLDVLFDVNSNLQLADSATGTGPYIYIGDGSQGAGFISIQNDQIGTGNVLVEAQSGFGGAFEFSGMTLNATVSSNFGNASHTTLMSVGASLASAIVTPSTSSDAFSTRKQSTSGAIRAALVQSEWAGSSTSSNAIQGLNIFVSTATSATGSLTGTAALRGNRVTARHRATNAGATVANAIAVSAAYISDASTAAVTNAFGYVAEPPTIGAGNTTTNYYGAFFDAGTVSGTLTNNYHVYLEELTGGTNRFEMLFQTAGRAYFRDASQYLYSSAASTLDDSAATTRNFRINGTTEMSISSTLVDIPTNDLAIASGAKFYFEGSGGDTYAYYDSGSSSLKFYVNGALAMELK